jgi:D-sedoheptulose 7-phosphate isomerase
MDQYPTIANNFQQTIELIAHSVDQLSPPIQKASASITQSLLNENKVICCGDGTSAALCQLFVCNMLSSQERDRPSLPAFSLANDAAALSAITSSYSFNDIYSKQIRALGQPGDILLTISNQQHNGSINQAVLAAHERKLTVICLNSTVGNDVSSLLLPEDIEMVVDSNHSARITEIHTMLILQLCEFIDTALFGAYER